MSSFCTVCRQLIQKVTLTLQRVKYSTEDVSVCVSEECEPSIWTLQKKNCLCLSLQVAVDGGEVEVSGQWNLASPLLPLTINGKHRMLQVTHTHTHT